MKYLLTALGMVACSVPALAANVAVAINIGQPGYYGRIDTAGFRRPEVLYAQPMVIQSGPARLVRDPVYLRVPPGHAKNWPKHCRKYDACAQPVYFVRDDWYTDVYAPRYREVHGKSHEHEKHHDKNGKKYKKKGHDHDND